MPATHKVVTEIKRYKKHPAVRFWHGTKKECEYFAAQIQRRWEGRKIKISIEPI